MQQKNMNSLFSTSRLLTYTKRTVHEDQRMSQITGGFDSQLYTAQAYHHEG